MSCSNMKCPRTIISSFSCNKCSVECCSNKCLTEHLGQEHKGKHPRIPVKLLSKRSVFNIEGRILKEHIDDPIYDFKNFEFCRTKANKIQTIGSGAFGNVFLSKNIKDEKLYAIKHIRKSKLIAAGESLDIVYREISIHRLLVHDNIIRLYSHNEDEDNIFMMMEYADSGSLFHLIRKKGGLDEAEAFRYFIQCAAAVAFLHENGFAHRDLKPENLLVTQSNQIKLCDFGWCVDASSGERGTFCGTYEYMAPEIVKEVPYDKSIDAWSLGVLLYELLHGHSPFRAEKEKGEDSYQEIFKNIMKHKYTIEKDIGKACADLISKLLTQDHNERLKVKEIFKHPWVLDFESDKVMTDSIIEKKPEADDKHIEGEAPQEVIKESNKSKPDASIIDSILDNNNEGSNKKANKLIITKKKSSNKDILSIIEKDSNDNRNIAPEKKYNVHCKAIQSSQSLKSSDTNFSLFEDKVFEDTLKKIDKKPKRKVKNELEHDEIRISKTKQNAFEKNDFFLLRNSNIKEERSQAKKEANTSNSREKTSAESNSKAEMDTPLGSADIQSNKKEIEQVPSVREEVYLQMENKGDNLLAALEVLEKAQNLQDRSNAKPKLQPPEENFWDKLFAPFKCGNNP